MKRYLSTLAAAVCCLTFAAIGCSSGAGDGSGNSSGTSDVNSVPKGVVAYSAMTLKNPFFKIIADNITSEAEKNGFSVLVNDAELDVNTQSKHVENYIAQKASAIILNPVDRVAIAPAIKKANAAGIPVFTCDLQCAAEDVKIAGHIGTDNFQGGRLAGEAMVDALGDNGGKVLILHFKQANSCVLRVEGFRERIAEHNDARTDGRIDIVSELDGGGLRDKGYRATSDAMQTHPDLNAIFAINDPSALGACTALDQLGKADQVTVIGFDGQVEGKQAIKDGKIYADPIQFPARMGKVTVQNIVAFLNGDEYERTQLIPTELYKKADADKDPELK
jgi:ribose transport system substrate-binding protein